MCTNMGGKGNNPRSSIYDKNGILKNSMRGISFDANNLDGTQRQREYAQDIINRAYNNIDKQIERIQREEGTKVETGSAYSDTIYKANAAIQSYLDIKKVFQGSLGGKMNTAEKVIKNKWQFENALPAQREALEVKYQKQFLEEIKKKKK